MRRATTIAKSLVALCLLSGSPPGGDAQSLPRLGRPPSIGCSSDGQSGPRPPPVAPRAAPLVAAGPATRLAYYDSGTLAVLAPRGWSCIAINGSGGAFLLVTPRLYTEATLPGFNRLNGPVVELSFDNGENAGRDQVAAVFARLFPSKRRFIRAVIETDASLGYAPAISNHPYPGDWMTHRSPSVVDFTTPPHRLGMGTFNSRLGAGANSIMGTAMLAHSNSVDRIMVLRVRMARSDRALTSAIVDAAKANGPPPSH